MIRPILACIDPYKAAEEFAAVGWNVDLRSLRRVAILWWGDMAFEVRIGGYQFMIAAVKGNEL